MGPNRPMPARGGALPVSSRGADRYFELKSQIHRKLIGVLNLERASSIPKDRIRAEIGRVVERLLDEERVAEPLRGPRHVPCLHSLYRRGVRCV